MERLTTRQIEDFNNPMAFARDRVTRIGQQTIGLITNRPIRTNDIEQSFRLVTGASERLETLENNLNTMLQLAREGQRANTPRKLQEVYGKLRSLSAGFDQVVDAIKFNGQTVFKGNDLFLSLGPGARPLQVEASKLLTYGDKSLNLSTADPTADVRVTYRTDDLILNSGYSIVGLDIDDAAFIRGSNIALELEDGDYKIAVSYMGKDSSVEIRSLTGTLIERRDNVDLSGEGREWVDFDVGVRLTFAKEQFLQSIDKYDFEELGPARLSATMSYRRVDAHLLRTLEEPPKPDSASFLFNTPLQTADSKLALSNPRISPVNPTRQALDSGSYVLEVEYFGKNSVIRLSDGLGRLKAFQFGVDLTESGTRRIDLGVGLSFDLEVDNFTNMGAKLVAPVEFQRDRTALEDFDFRKYAKRITDAIGVVIEQRERIDKAKERIEEINQLRNLASTQALPSSLAFNSTNALTLLNGGGDNSLFRPASPTARLNNMANQLFGTTTALPTQANITPQSLNQARMASASGWLNTFS